MAALIWAFLRNPFEIVTRGNYLKMMAIAKYTDLALHGQIANAAILAIYNVYHPLYLAFKNVYDAWFSSDEGHISSTDAVLALEKLLSGTYIRQWDAAIQQHYDVPSTRYKELLPHRRKPFQKGGHQDRLSAVTTLLEAIGTDANLAALKVTVTAFLTSYENAIEESGMDITGTEVSSAAVETQRLLMADGLMDAYASLIKTAINNLASLLGYFDVENIMNKKQTSFDVTVPRQSWKVVFVHTFKANDKMEITSHGDADLNFGVGLSRTEPFTGPPFFSITGHSQSTCMGSQVMNNGYRYFIVRNDTDQDGEFTLKRFF